MENDVREDIQPSDENRGNKRNPNTALTLYFHSCSLINTSTPTFVYIFLWFFVFLLVNYTSHYMQFSMCVTSSGLHSV